MARPGAPAFCSQLLLLGSIERPVLLFPAPLKDSFPRRRRHYPYWMHAHWVDVLLPLSDAVRSAPTSALLPSFASHSTADVQNLAVLTNGGPPTASGAPAAPSEVVCDSASDSDSDSDASSDEEDPYAHYWGDVEPHHSRERRVTCK